MSPEPMPTSVASGILIHLAIWAAVYTDTGLLTSVNRESAGCCAPFRERELGPHLAECPCRLPLYHVIF